MAGIQEVQTYLRVDLGGGAYYDATFSNPTATSEPHNHFIARFNPPTQLEWCTFYWEQYSFSHATSHGVEIEFKVTIK